MTTIWQPKFYIILTNLPMTREEFIAKIENPDDVERVMARVDEGAELLQYNIIGNIEKWYDDCAKFYDASVFKVDEETQAFQS